MNRRTILNSRWLIPALLLLISTAAFGLLIPWLGFYWDDWAKILVSRLFGLGRYVAYYAEDRPLSAWTHIVFTPLLGNNPAAWQVLSLVLRWLSAWILYTLLGQLWPDARRQNLSATLLYLLYPVFTQHSVAVTFFQQWIQLSFFFFSLLAMVKAVLSSGRRAAGWILASLAAMLLQLSVTEYFVSIELIRPLVLAIALANGQPAWVEKTWLRRALQVLKAWGPYLAGLAAYVIWRLFFLKLSIEDPYRANTLYDFIQSPWQTVQKLFPILVTDVGRILVGCWQDLLSISGAGVQPFSLFALGLGAVMGVLAGFVLLRLAEPTDEGRSRWLRQALWLGLAAALLGGIPAWITGRMVVFDFHSDRHAMASMFGAGLVWAAVIEWVAQRRVQRAVLVGLLVALAVGLHLRAANEYRWIWTAQQRLYWQLSWRAPGLQAPTALFFETEPFPNQGLFSTSAAINLIYPQPSGWPADPATGEPQLGYWVYALSPRYKDAPESYEIGLSTRFRTLKFTGSTPNSLLIFNESRAANCAWVLTSRDADHPYLSDLMRDFLPISNPERILNAATPGYPPQDILGPEPDHRWCYYFEKADLARQMQDWAEVVHLGDAALELGYYPDISESNSPYEWMPFIEGYANTGNWEQAARLIEAAFQKDNHYGGMLCNLWSEEITPGPEAGNDASFQSWTAAGATLGCPPSVQ